MTNGGGRAGFAALVDGAIHAAAAELTARTRELMVAHSAFETNWGHTTGYMRGNNLWNITAGSHWKGRVVQGPDTEVDAQGRVKDIRQLWRVYPTLEAAVVDYLQFLTMPQYMPARLLLLDGDLKFIDALRLGGFFTLELPKYIAGVAAALTEVETFKGVS